MIIIINIEHVYNQTYATTNTTGKSMFGVYYNKHNRKTIFFQFVAYGNKHNNKKLFLCTMTNKTIKHFVYHNAIFVHHKYITTDYTCRPQQTTKTQFRIHHNKHNNNI